MKTIEIVVKLYNHLLYSNKSKSLYKHVGSLMIINIYFFNYFLSNSFSFFQFVNIILDTWQHFLLDYKKNNIP